MYNQILKVIAIIMLIAGALLALWFLILGGYLLGNPIPDPDKAKEINPFITGLVVPLLTLGSTLLVLENLIASTLQNFSNNFFNLINQHHRLVENLSTAVDGISKEKNPTLKRDVFDDLAHRIVADFKFAHKSKEEIEDLERELKLKPNTELKVKSTDPHEMLVEIYDHYFHIHHSELSHYFRNLYHIVKFVDDTKFSKKIKYKHVKILRAQLSNYEILLLAYNCLHAYGNKFFPLVEKYKMLKNLNSEEDLNIKRTRRIVDFSLLRMKYKHLDSEYIKRNPEAKPVYQG